MKKWKNKFKKLFIIIAILIMNALGFMNAVYATSIESANVYKAGYCGDLLKYKGVVVKVGYIQYSCDGNNYPAYCLDKAKTRS